MVAIVMYAPSITMNAVPTGWTAWSLGTVGAGSKMCVYTRVVQAGDAKTYTWGWATAQYQSVFLYEVQTVSGVISSQTCPAGGQTPPISFTTAAETGRGLAIAFAASQYSGTRTASAGWTADLSTATVGYAASTWVQNTVSTAGSSIVVTITGDGAVKDGGGIVVIGT
jgi:hypothetical protein